ncbi:MAG: VOC family protein [Roseitalea porphyridii]
MDEHAQTAATNLPGPATRIGAVRLAVRDLDAARDFYTRAIGLEPVAGDGATTALGIDGRPLVELEAAPDERPAPRGASGLFHLALLVPERPALAAAVRRVVDAGARFSGAADHLVSEALYLNDPEGNGIEIYRDRPRDEWPSVDGRLQMDTLPIDLDGVMAERPDAPAPATMEPGTTMGHIHLRVDDLDAAGRFAVGVLGLDVMVDTYPGALFVAAGGYHHHIGMNTWGSPRPAQPGSLGLRHYELVVDDARALAALAARAEGAGAGAPDDRNGLRAVDPAGNTVLVRAAG